MASLRDIQRKIASVKNISKITQAMKMVAAAKLRKAQDKVGAARPYSEKLRDLLLEVAPRVPDEVKRKEPLLHFPEADEAGDDPFAEVAALSNLNGHAGSDVVASTGGKRIGVVVITSNRGLCGSYNNNMIRRAAEFMRAQQAEGVGVKLITIGLRGTRSLRNQGFDPVASFPMVDVDTPFTEIRKITDTVVGLYHQEQDDEAADATNATDGVDVLANGHASTEVDDTVDEVHIAYSKFINAVTQMPTVDRFLPVDAGDVFGDEPEAAAEAEGHEGDEAATPTGDVDFEFEPDAERLLEVLLPRYVDNQVYQYLLEATASEYGARMTAMSKASDNAKELIDTLTLAYNRARQDAITKEILDIVGGAEALR